MEIVSLEEFYSRTTGGRTSKMDTTYYQGSYFLCGCGQEHCFEHNDIRVIRELPRMKLVLKRDKCNYVTCVKVRGLFKFKGFKSLFSTKDRD